MGHPERGARHPRFTVTRLDAAAWRAGLTVGALEESEEEKKGTTALPLELTVATKGEPAIDLLRDAHTDGVRLDCIAGDPESCRMPIWPGVCGCDASSCAPENGRRRRCGRYAVRWFFSDEALLRAAAG